MIEVTPLYLRLPGDWAPGSKAQLAALTCPAEFLLFGGAAGSLKSETMLIAAAQQYQQPSYKAVIFRRSYPQIKFLIDRARILYSQMGASPSEGGKDWKWPWGSQVIFRYCDKDDDVYNYLGDAFQFLGFDESTRWKEWSVRYLISRVRSTQGLKQQIFMASNPGGPGHDFNKAIFQGKKCWHCKPTGEGQREAFKLYTDGVWPSDKRPIGMSTCFIPGKLTDHSMLGPEYVAKLKSMPEKIANALLDGCWESFEGQYFDIWNPEQHVMDIDDIDRLIQPWWPKWVGCDYGFGHAAVAYLFTKAPDGKIYVIDEVIRHHVSAAPFAAILNERWAHYDPTMWALSPDAFKHDGTGDFSKAQLMTDATGIGFSQAYNERPSGWQLCYKLLETNQMIIGSNCEGLQDAIQTRIHDDKRMEDVLKNETDADDRVDAWRYGLATYIQPGSRPKQEIMDEHLAKFTDPTAQMMALRMMRAASRNEGKPINYRSRSRLN